MEDSAVVTAEDVRLMQGLAEKVTALRLELVNSDASVGELAWIWGKGHAKIGASWRRELWFAGRDLVAWGWVTLPHRRPNGQEITQASLAYQVHPDHAELVDEVIAWYDRGPAVDRTLLAQAADDVGRQRWGAHGYVTDPAALDDWTQLNVRDLDDIEKPVLPTGFRFRNADGAGSAAAVRAHVDAWGSTIYDAESYEGVRQTWPYRGDLHVLVEAPDGTMAASAIIWLDEANKTAEFEPVGTHPGYRRLGLGRALLLHGMGLAREAGANHMTVVCLGAAAHPKARGLYYSVGFRKFSQDVSLIKPAAARPDDLRET
ncbi:GNAT family N-acetyltransferase [Kutzneria sp. NPDC052558]|uniref:GNAT family N-acetyltransferase n=1 Tax=Kutzneria sp. NPDC052558 TaxID=3364121 RepID=UPI0037CABFD7